MSNGDIFNLIIQVGIPVGLIILAWFTGRAVERRHFRNLAQREEQLAHMIVSDLKCFPMGAAKDKGAAMVQGQVVIATDYLKTFLAGFRKIFGGELHSYESLMERARREAVLRMMEEAGDQGFDAVCNLRMGFADIGAMSGRKGSVMVAVFAYGTAYCKTGENL